MLTINFTLETGTFVTAIRLDHTLYTELANQLYPDTNPAEDTYGSTFGGVSNNNNNNNVYEQYQPDFAGIAPIPTEPPYRPRPVTDPPYRPIPVTQRPFVQQPVEQQQPSFSGQAAPNNPHVIPMPALPSPSYDS